MLYSGIEYLLTRVMSIFYPNTCIQFFPFLINTWAGRIIKMKTATELFGARIRELRKQRGMIQEQLADVIGIEQKHVSLIERGKSYPSLDRLMRIAEVLQVPLPALFVFEHLEDAVDRARSIEADVQALSEQDQRRVFKIVKMFKEG